jgi:hypothetical protein
VTAQSQGIDSMQQEAQQAFPVGGYPAGTPSAVGVCPRPIFVIGSLRSGASLLSLSLGQHPNILLTMETRWFERFSIGLQQAYAAGVSPRATSQLDIAGIEIEDMFEQFGRTIDGLMLTVRSRADVRRTRWLDGTQVNSLNVFPLLRLFPKARFIHVLRDVHEVVDSLTDVGNKALYKSRYIKMSHRQATDHWVETVTACVEAERAFGSDTVLRVRRCDLVDAPEQSIRRCLEFLEEPYDPICLRPLRSLTNAEARTVDGTDSLDGPERTPGVSPASLLNDLLLHDEAPHFARNEAAVIRLEMEFSRRCELGSGVSNDKRRSRHGLSASKALIRQGGHHSGELLWSSVRQAVRTRLGSLSRRRS